MSHTPDSQQQYQREADIIDRHLPEGYTAQPDAVDYAYRGSRSNTQSPGPQELNNASGESSLRLQGGDIHRDLYKIKARAATPRRAQTFSHAASPRLGPINQPSVQDQLEPGGFRRQYVQQRQGLSRLSSVATNPVTKNFVSFLELYGSFAGEDLADTDSESDEESAVDEADSPSETRPLLRRQKSSKRFKREGDAGDVKTFFTLLKAFVGTGIMFLPKAFRNGGILFSSITLIAVSIITSICFRLLLQCRKRFGGGYGELGESIVGPAFRKLILASITLSQLGFVCAGLIFTAENLFSFLNAVTKGKSTPLGINALIAIQLVLLIPLALIRNISKLGPAALLADVFILIGLTYIWYFDIAHLAQHGMHPTVELFNPSSFTLTIGSAIFTFEGIGLILPIQSSMKNPEHFSYLLYLVMLIITVIFTSVGVLCYATFGDQTKIQIISNFPQTDKLVNAVQFLYSMAVLVGGPVQLFPAVRIIEQKIFGDRASGKKSATVKWKKNALRSGMISICAVVALLGATDLDKFVALIGSFACVPLVYIYPAYLHYKGVASSRHERYLDIGLMTLGVVAMAYTTIVTVAQWIGA
ncbi:hypothetical protein EJ05DRAFT_267444 [Pseudovirgaria hyperparasitica]|uniref:Amino acid transporter transmembrane domain-containing protein n=1 Tax=Pseudovirgaria hyperparasitica TaxID=470096 RepID=A0A6A6VSK1_9PEZI|nr:uncharacterized protein EJ05DRAFT_267444 [Pseudovirgaria hyperparasitica]KAF2752734.1 hypothetical protein EJ05DRAFT_267444 [Pseudovirgaria hyperparasitica]